MTETKTKTRISGRLEPCPDSPNCVSTEADDPAKRMPPLRFDGPPEAARGGILTVLEGRRRVRVVEASEDYVHAEFTTPLFRFVDDVEFWIDVAGGKVHYRSASRVGHSDLGVNRRRMRTLSRRLMSHDPRWSLDEAGG